MTPENFLFSFFFFHFFSASEFLRYSNTVLLLISDQSVIGVAKGLQLHSPDIIYRYLLPYSSSVIHHENLLFFFLFQSSLSSPVFPPNSCPLLLSGLVSHRRNKRKENQHRAAEPRGRSRVGNAQTETIERWNVK